jgi:adenosylhomocysteinase
VPCEGRARILRIPPVNSLPTVERVERERLRSYWDEIVDAAARSDDAPGRSLVVTHLLGDRPYFLEALNRVAPIERVLAKPKSIESSAYRRAAESFPMAVADRKELTKKSGVQNLLSMSTLGDEKLLAIDIGGYFAPALEHLASEANLCGVVEDTENGQQKYEAQRGSGFPCPVLSVARSPLKNAEDYLVGHSVVFSTEALMRSRGDVLQGRSACVIGYGKIGRSVARLLRSHGVQIAVHDIDPVPLTEAHAHGFAVHSDRKTAMAGAGIIICATGNLALSQDAFRHVEPGAYVVSVTSSDDELDLGPLKESYERNRIATDIVRYRRRDERRSEAHFFFVLNNGEAVNFLHGAVVGPAIQLVQAEIVMAAARLLDGSAPEAGAIGEVSADDRATIARIWLKHFAQGGHP